VDCEETREYVLLPSPRARVCFLDRSSANPFNCSSDADADVLADYVLALLRHDGDINTVRRLCEEEIPDFLKEGISAV
jgi:hypothetical protein